MNGSLGTLLPSSVPSSLSPAVTSPEDERRCAPFAVGDEHAAVSRAASPAPIKVLLSTLVGPCPLPGLLWATVVVPYFIESLHQPLGSPPGKSSPLTWAALRPMIGVRSQRGIT